MLTLAPLNGLLPQGNQNGYSAVLPLPARKDNDAYFFKKAFRVLIIYLIWVEWSVRAAGLACPPLKKPCRNKSVSSFSVKHRSTYFLVSSALGRLPPFKTTGSIACPHPVNTGIPCLSELYLLSPESLGHQLSNASGGFSRFTGVILPSAGLWSSLPSCQPQSYLNTPVHPGTNITQSTPLSSTVFFFF